MKMKFLRAYGVDREVFLWEMEFRASLAPKETSDYVPPFLREELVAS